MYNNQKYNLIKNIINSSQNRPIHKNKKNKNKNIKNTSKEDKFKMIIIEILK